MISHERIVASTRNRIGALLGLRATMMALIVWLLVWGTLVLVLRAIWAVPRELLLWGLVGLIGAVLFGVVVGVRRRPPLETVVAMLDARWQLGGLLMAASDANLGQWRVNLPQASAPRLHWRGGRQGAVLLCSVIFVLASFFVPAHFLALPASQRMAIADEVQKLASKIELLKVEKILTTEKAYSLEQSLEQLQRDAAGDDPAKTWEALDHIEQSVAKASAQAAEQTAREAQQAARAEELAAALDIANSQMAAAELTAALQSLAKDVQQAEDENASLQNELSDELKHQLETGSLTPEQLAALADALGKCKAANLATIGKLADARLIDPTRLRELLGQCEIDPDALATLLADCQGGNCPGSDDILALWNRPGRGGITRGRGDAAMTWDDANQEDVKFKEMVLPPSAVASLKDTTLSGVSVGSPTTSQPGEADATGALDVSNAGRGSARTQVILPEYRRVIQRYFERNAKSRTPGTKAP